jgi:hypothetical protein
VTTRRHRTWFDGQTREESAGRGTYLFFCNGLQLSPNLGSRAAYKCRIIAATTARPA